MCYTKHAKGNVYLFEKGQFFIRLTLDTFKYRATRKEEVLFFSFKMKLYPDIDETRRLNGHKCTPTSVEVKTIQVFKLFKGNFIRSIEAGWPIRIGAHYNEPLNKPTSEKYVSVSNGNIHYPYDCLVLTQRRAILCHSLP